MQFAEYQALYELNPWGEARDDLRSAHQTMHLLAPHAQSNQVLVRSNYLIRFGDEHDAATEDREREEFHAAAAAIRKQRRRRLGRHR